MKTLVLNSDYRPLSVISTRRAVVLGLYSKNITVLSYYSHSVRSEKTSTAIPAVIVCNHYVNAPRYIPPSKRNIRTRDKNKCGYCGIELDEHTFTVDHIIPVSRFAYRKDANTWENQISACRRCNNKKADRTPRESGMKLLHMPKKQTSILIHGQVPKEWEQYL